MPLAYSLNKLLKNQQILPYFIHFLDASGGIELLQFLIHVQSYYSSHKTGTSTQEDLQKDAVAIFSLFIDKDAGKRIDFPVEMVQNIEGRLPSAPRDLFKEAEIFTYSKLESCKFLEFKEHFLFKKHEAEILLGDPTFLDLIHIESLLQELLELISSVEDKTQLQFILACEAYEDEYWKWQPEVVLDDAIGIYDRYISLQATIPLEITSSERLAIESAICQPNGRPDRGSFHPLRDRLAQRLGKKYLSRLKESRAFVNHLEELTNHTEGLTPRSSISDGSSIRSPKSWAGSPGEGKRFSFSGEKDSMLTTALPGSSKTSTLAQVDSLGRYRPMFDEKRWHTDKKNNKIKEKLSRLLSKKSAKDEEEANEAAMAIIQDVQRMVSQRSFDY